LLINEYLEQYEAEALAKIANAMNLPSVTIEDDGMVWYDADNSISGNPYRAVFDPLFILDDSLKLLAWYAQTLEERNIHDKSKQPNEILKKENKRRILVLSALELIGIDKKGMKEKE